MIIIMAKTDLIAGKKQLFIDAVTPLMAATRQEKGCVAYEAFEDLDNPNVMIIFERWADQASLDAHLTTTHYKEWIGKTKEFRTSGAQLTHYRAL